jgi:HSP90 family molecular chaperone
VLLFDQAMLLEEGQLPQAADFSRRLNRLLGQLAGVQ